MSSFWQTISEKQSLIGELDAERESLWAQYSDKESWHQAIRRGGFIEDVAGFDALFFGIAPREAESMDPQQRLLLHNHWRALEHANISPQQLQGSNTAVYVGIFTHDYESLQTH